MRILFEPKALVLRCSECDTTIELKKGEFYLYHAYGWIMDQKPPDNANDRWQTEHRIRCPNCDYPFNNETDRIVPNLSAISERKDKCESCGVILGENDKFCNSCGHPV